MQQITLDLDYYKPICNCEGCFKDSTTMLELGGEEFYVCDYHNIELMRTDEQVEETIYMSQLTKAINYRQEIFSYNSE